MPAAGLTPGTAPAPQPAAGAASEAAPLPNDYVPTGPQKAHTLPTIYYINLDEEKDMRERLERNLKPYTEKLVRVPAVNKADVVVRTGEALFRSICHPRHPFEIVETPDEVHSFYQFLESSASLHVKPLE